MRLQEPDFWLSAQSGPHQRLYNCLEEILWLKCTVKWPYHNPKLACKLIQTALFEIWGFMRRWFYGFCSSSISSNYFQCVGKAENIPRWRFPKGARPLDRTLPPLVIFSAQWLRCSTNMCKMRLDETFPGCFFFFSITPLIILYLLTNTLCSFFSPFCRCVVLWVCTIMWLSAGASSTFFSRFSILYPGANVPSGGTAAKLVSALQFLT